MMQDAGGQDTGYRILDTGLQDTGLQVVRA